MFYTLKFVFAGDEEFTYEKFWNLPYVYVLECYKMAQKMEQRRLHLQEKTSALHMSLAANLQRDPKKKKTPYTMSDFFLYQPRSESNKANAKYGSAAMKLIQDGLYPTWALFCFSDLTAHADNDPPSLVAFMAEDAILLGPLETGPGAFSGLLIAEESCSLQERVFTSPCGRTVKLRLPHIPTKTIAQEGITLHQC